MVIQWIQVGYTVSGSEHHEHAMVGEHLVQEMQIEDLS